MNRSAGRFLAAFLALLVLLSGVVPAAPQNHLVLGREAIVTGQPALSSEPCLPQEPCAVQDDDQDIVSQVFSSRLCSRLRGISTAPDACEQPASCDIVRESSAERFQISGGRDPTPGRTALISHIHRTRRKRP